jgi:hypothetical protein
VLLLYWAAADAPGCWQRTALLLLLLLFCATVLKRP